MRFGIFHELSVPRPWTPDAERRVYENALEQTRLADELGFDWVWAVEHHFLEEYSHCSSPEVFLAAAARETKRIRVGHGVVVCVPQMNHPIRLAERAAALDIISGGRLEFGTGRSSTWTELGGFQADPDETKKTWDEYVRVIPKMWTQERFTYEGRSFSMPERAVLPKPVQKPHPPMWVAVTSPGTELDAAERGLGCLGLAVAGPAEQEKTLGSYRKRIASCDPVGEVVNDTVTTLNFLFCHENRDLAADRGLAMAGTFTVHNTHLLFTREAYPTTAYQLLANLAPRAGSSSDGGDPGEHRQLPEGLAIGDPDHCIEQIKSWESVGVDGINFLLNANETLTQDEVLESMRLFARDVMPAFPGGSGVSPDRNTRTSARRAEVGS